jgi:hypothetical protein
MNVPRRVFKASTNTVKSLYDYGQKSTQGYLIEGSIIVILIVLTAIVIKFLPIKFLCFFNNVIVKVIFLIVIAFVALYCPAIGLMMAILLVSIIQMCQRKQLSMDIDRIKNNHSQMKNKQPDMKIFESLESNPPIDVDQPDYYENEKDGNEPDGTENFENIQGESENEYDNSGFEPQGVDKMFSSCISQCGNGSNDSVDSSRELNGMCGVVKTWENQFSAQGLDGEVVGYQSSLGYPL